MIGMEGELIELRSIHRERTEYTKIHGSTMFIIPEQAQHAMEMGLLPSGGYGTEDIDLAIKYMQRERKKLLK